MKTPRSTIYNVPFILNFQSDLNVSELAAAVKKIIASPPSVNVHFELQGENIMQVVNSKTDFDIPVKNISENEFENAKNNFVQPFKLSAETLYRFEIVKTENRVSLFTDFHHLIFDGTSMNLFFANLQTVLEGKTIESEKFTYFDYVDEESALIEKNKKYFAEMLKDFELASEITYDAKNSAEKIKIYDAPLNLNLPKLKLKNLSKMSPKLSTIQSSMKIIRSRKLTKIIISRRKLYTNISAELLKILIFRNLLTLKISKTNSQKFCRITWCRRLICNLKICR